MMALVDDDMTVFANVVLDHTIADQTLYNRNVQLARRLAATAADSSNLTVVDAQERRQPLHPLIEQLPPMHKHECVDAALRDQPRSDNCFPERRRRSQHSRFMFQHGVCCCLLLRPKRSLKCDAQGSAVTTLVTRDRHDVQLR